MSLWTYYVPGTVPRTGDTDNYKSNRDAVQGKQIRKQYNGISQLCSESSAGRCFSEERFHSQLILETSGKHKEIFFPKLLLKTFNSQICGIQVREKSKLPKIIDHKTGLLVVCLLLCTFAFMRNSGKWSSASNSFTFSL